MKSRTYKFYQLIILLAGTAYWTIRYVLSHLGRRLFGDEYRFHGYDSVVSLNKNNMANSLPQSADSARSSDVESKSETEG